MKEFFWYKGQNSNLFSSLGELKKSVKTAVTTNAKELEQLLSDLEANLLNQPELALSFCEIEQLNEQEFVQYVHNSLLAQWQTYRAQLKELPLVFRPTGLIFINLPKVMSFRLALETIVPALLAGNSVIVRFSTSQVKLLENLVKAFSAVVTERSPFFSNIAFTSLSHESTEILCQHPSINAVLAFGKRETLEKINALSGWKKKSLMGPGSNSMMIIDWSREEETKTLIKESVCSGRGAWPWNVKKILITEKDAPKLFDFLIGLKLNYPEPNKELLSQIKDQVLRDQGRVILGPEQGFWGLVTQNLSHCSILQQEELSIPIVMVSEVKYLHEMLKWNNTGDLDLVTVICGDPEKAQRLAVKCEVGEVWINKWLPEGGVPVGVKMSHHGLRSRSVFGNLFSNYPETL